MDVGAWLRGLGLERYEQVFRENRIEADVLPRLTVEDLKDLGVTLVGDRRRLLDAIAALGAEAPAAAVTGAPELAEAERRQLTVMFCDLVGSTELSARLDPEDLRDVDRRVPPCRRRVVAGFDGFVAKYMGDGVLIYFGYPRAHEDDAERCSPGGAGSDRRRRPPRCQIRQAASARRYRHRAGGRRRSDRRGLGAGAIGRWRNAEPRRPAASLGRAGRGRHRRRAHAGWSAICSSIAISARSRSRGIAGPVPAWQVLRPSAVASRFEALRGSTLDPARRPRRGDRPADCGVGSAPKPATARSCWSPANPASASRASPQHWKSAFSGEPHLRQRYFCSPYRQDSALYPFIDQIGRAAGLTPADQPAAKLEKLEALLARGSTCRTRMSHSSPICCHCRPRSATPWRTSVRSAKRSGHWRR